MIYPSTGDLLSCTDGDVGIVLSTYQDGEDFMVRVAWSSRPHMPLTDPWNSEDFSTEHPMFHIINKI